VLILDETTASLTPKEVAELFAIVRRLRDEGCAIAFVSHRLDEVFEICDRITVLRDGEKVGERIPAQSSIPEVVRMMVGRDVAAAERASSPNSGEVVLDVHQLAQGKVFSNVSFQVRKGEIVGMAGLVGAGRTDVAEAIFGITTPTAGTISIYGKEITVRNPKEAMAEGLALVPEDRQHHGLLLPVSIAENASLAILRSLTKVGMVQKNKVTENAETYRGKLKIALHDVNQAVKDLSGGNQQKVVLSKWLLTEPKVLILDEPTRGIDIGAKAEVHRLMRELADSGLAILMISSDLQEVLTVSDRVLVMREGQLVKNLALGEATEESVMLAATGQVAHAS
jgi:ABC-type sugar transport system ATPase subunit